MWGKLSTAKKIIVGTAGGLLLLGAIGAAGQPTPKKTATIELTPSAATKGAETARPAPQPTIETKMVTETEPIPFSTTTVNDPTLEKGKTAVTAQGVNGVRTKTYKVTLTNGKETARELIKEEVSQQPVTQVTALGTKVAANCDPNYSGACVPIASDVDCAGGSGNGPAYVQGPVRVIGTDVYGLDRDGNGIGCES